MPQSFKVVAEKQSPIKPESSQTTEHPNPSSRGRGRGRQHRKKPQRDRRRCDDSTETASDRKGSPNSTKNNETKEEISYQPSPNPVPSLGETPMHDYAPVMGVMEVPSEYDTPILPHQDIPESHPDNIDLLPPPPSYFDKESQKPHSLYTSPIASSPVRGVGDGDGLPHPEGSAPIEPSPAGSSGPIFSSTTRFDELASPNTQRGSGFIFDPSSSEQLPIPPGTMMRRHAAQAAAAQVVSDMVSPPPPPQTALSSHSPLRRSAPAYTPGWQSTAIHYAPPYPSFSYQPPQQPMEDVGSFGRKNRFQRQDHQNETNVSPPSTLDLIETQQRLAEQTGQQLPVHNPKLPDHLWILDPFSHKLYVPKECVLPTAATVALGSTPSLCLPFLDGRCFDVWCRQAHVFPEAVYRLRTGIHSQPTCCQKHGADVTSKEVTANYDFMTLHLGISQGTVTFQSDECAVTVGLLRFMAASRQRLKQQQQQQQMGEPKDLHEESLEAESDRTLSIPIKMVCRLHMSNNCRYREDCNNVHPCRQHPAIRRALNLPTGIQESKPSFPNAVTANTEGYSHAMMSDRRTQQKQPERFQSLQSLLRVTPQSRDVNVGGVNHLSRPLYEGQISDGDLSRLLAGQRSALHDDSLEVLDVTEVPTSHTSRHHQQRMPQLKQQGRRSGRFPSNTSPR